MKKRNRLCNLGNEKDKILQKSSLFKGFQRQ